MTIGKKHVAVYFHSDGDVEVFLGFTRLGGTVERGSVRLPPQNAMDLGEMLIRVGRAAAEADRVTMQRLADEINGPQPKEVASAGA